MPRTSPTTHPGQGSRMLQTTNPRPKRAINAPSMAARLSGKVRGIINAVSRPPKTKPQRAPREILDIAGSSSRSSNRIAVSNASNFSDTIAMSHCSNVSIVAIPTVYTSVDLNPLKRPSLAVFACPQPYEQQLLYNADRAWPSLFSAIECIRHGCKNTLGKGL